MPEKKRALRIAIPVFSQDGYVNYFEALRQLGAAGVIAGADAAASDYDGLLLPGGGDIEPERYGQTDMACEGIDALLDALQFGALDAFVRAGKPVLGICRGHQVIAVAFGGALVQHVEGHRKAKGETVERVHPVRSVPGSWIDGIYGPEAVVNSSHHQVVEQPDGWVNSIHHQAVTRQGDGLIADQFAPDGVIEAMHHRTLPIWSVQWHPERLCFGFARPDAIDGRCVLQWFLDRCREG